MWGAGSTTAGAAAAAGEEAAQVVEEPDNGLGPCVSPTPDDVDEEPGLGDSIGELSRDCDDLAISSGDVPTVGHGEWRSPLSEA